MCDWNTNATDSVSTNVTNVIPTNLTNTILKNVISTVPINSNDKKVRYWMDYILHTFLLLTISFFTIAIFGTIKQSIGQKKQHVGALTT